MSILDVRPLLVQHGIVFVLYPGRASLAAFAGVEDGLHQPVCSCQ